MTMEFAWSALKSLTFNSVHGPDDVWRTPPHHIDGLHPHSIGVLMNGVAEARTSRDTCPIGVVLQGQRGAGKTHMLGWLRDHVQREGGYFFLVGLLDAKGFWESVVVSMLDSLLRPGPDGESQLKTFLRRLSGLVDLPRMARRAVYGEKALSREDLDAFVGALRRFDDQIGRESQDTARALVLCVCTDLRAQDVGDGYLYATPEGEPGERAAWGIRKVNKTAQEIVRDLSRLLAMTGPSVIALDQLDSLVVQSSISTDISRSDISVKEETPDDLRRRGVIEHIAGGLMSLREVTRRTLMVVSCLPATWVLIEKFATDTVRDRFRESAQLMTIPSAEVGRELIAKRFEGPFREIGFEPPYPTWPVRPDAFDLAPNYTPRQLLTKVGTHVQACLINGEITELARLDETIAVGRPAVAPMVVKGGLEALDTRFAMLADAADVALAVGEGTEDAVMPALLSAGLTAWIAQRGDEGAVFSVDPLPSSKPPLHARLRRTLDDVTEDEEHWGFRAICAKNAVAALNRLRGACVAAGLDAEVAKRRLFVLRNTAWAKGARTQEALAAFAEAGGRVLPVDDEDVRILVALRSLLAENPPHLREWLASRRPVDDVKLLAEALAEAWAAPGAAAREGGVSECLRVALGRTINGDRSVSVDLEALRKHTAIFAGTGSGKTVLIRRLVEECALRGVSAIVLDSNNDLARLGEAWPEEPSHWGAGDGERAREYLANTDVVVWTPGRTTGRPLGFQPLPDFASVADDADEFGEAVDAAAESIIPRVKLDAKTAKAQLGRAVLREALEYFGRQGSNSLPGFVEVLSALPDGVSKLADGRKLAAELGQTLTAAMVTDPLFGGAATPVDPGLLLTPAGGKRARVSVISLSGLPTDDQRRSFVNQLQMALFAWIKKNPAGDRPLGALFVMDEAQIFAPSGTVTVCTRSTQALASQARKYGLGLVFATQAPKGLHNAIPGNAATQIFGLLNSPIQITAAKEVARAKGGDVADVSRLITGQFYVAVEGMPFEKVRTPMCLTHHPESPLTPEEVVERARSNAHVV